MIVLALVGLGGCAGAPLRREPVGRWAAAVELRGAAPAASGPTVQLARGRYELALHIDVPRAQLVDYAVACTPSGAAPIRLAGRVGETFEAYRAHRLADLNVQQDRARSAAATAANTVAGFVPPGAVTVGAQSAAGARVETTASTDSVRYGATVSAEQAFPPVTELQPGDVGARRLEVHQTLMLPADATCVVRTTAEDPGVVAAYDVTRVRDLGAEARERQVAAISTARTVRVQLTASLVAAGADPLALQHRHEAEARARAEEEARRAALQPAIDAERARRSAEEAARRTELRAAADAERARYRAIAEAERDRRDREDALREEQRRHAELELRLQIEARLELVLEVRASLVAYLTGTCNADPNHLARMRAAELRVREERELRVRLALEARLTLEAKLRADRDARDARLRAERDAREAADRQRIEVALGVRGQLQAYLVSLGARPRPPMPTLLAEDPGAAPFDGARWSRGRWEWSAARWSWTWIAGGWTDATVFGDAGGSGVTVVREVAVEVPVEVPTTEVRTSSGGISVGTSVSTPAVRDHRAPPPPPSSPPPVLHVPVVRDHRTHPAPRPAPASAPRVRDHRKR